MMSQSTQTWVWRAPSGHTPPLQLPLSPHFNTVMTCLHSYQYKFNTVHLTISEIPSICDKIYTTMPSTVLGDLGGWKPTDPQLHLLRKLLMSSISGQKYYFFEFWYSIIYSLSGIACIFICSFLLLIFSNHFKRIAVGVIVWILDNLANETVLPSLLY